MQNSTALLPPSLFCVCPPGLLAKVLPEEVSVSLGHQSGALGRQAGGCRSADNPGTPERRTREARGWLSSPLTASTHSGHSGVPPFHGAARLPGPHWPHALLATAAEEVVRSDLRDETGSLGAWISPDLKHLSTPIREHHVSLLKRKALSAQLT